MSLEYIRRHYGVDAKKGGRVAFDYPKRRYGTIVGAQNQYLRVRLDDGETVTLHPTWQVEYDPELELAPMEPCEVCQEPTETPPLCERHQREQDDRDAAKAYREGRYE